MNLRDLQIGKAVVFRSGGQATVKSFKNLGTKTSIVFENYIGDNAWNNDGSFVSSSVENFMDIVDITEPAFQWANVRPGMAFRDTEDDVVIYIGKSMTTEQDVVCEYNEEAYHFDYDELTRDEENDVA